MGVVLAVGMVVSLAACGKAGSAGSTGTGAAAAGAGAAAAEPGTPRARKVVLESSVSNSKPVKLAWFVPSVQNDFQAANGKGIRVAAKARNATVTTFDANNDSQKQYGQIQDAVASGQYNAFLVTAVDATGVVPAIEEAAKAGIKVVCGGGYPCGSDFASKVSNAKGVVAQTVIPEVSIGRAQARVIVSACAGKDPCEVAQMPGALIPAEKALFGGMKQALASHPEIKIVTRAVGGYQAAPAETAAQNILQANPGVDVIVTSGDQMDTGVVLAVKAAGDQKKVKIIGLAGGQRGFAAVRNGTVFGTVMMYPFDAGLYMVDQAVRAVRSQPFKAGINPAEMASLPRALTAKNSAKFAGFTPQWPG
ncbi:sugar ABC transporter substrate-binding protein [Leekyejoonella antrihumi]|uniref:Sugar ABC transporter substrate-binding protein n=1 Tax=Leekyejoonella antrihumi TaxID=1660198 RepID=A0A563DQ17_9MICO|nr:sugar ABC transporter substrate-binding protein [Leekyejoonella antrihumi]TWP32317.1 sugar ABC transporter substrate-binding protein [Leekyejoonella antrihumi]